MPRLNISNLNKPLLRFRVDRAPEARFESRSQSREEDSTRARLLRKAAVPTKYRAEARELADRLAGDKVPETLASKRCMREHRISTMGAMWPLVEAAGSDISLAVIIPPDWSYSAEELMQVDPRRLLAAFRQTLYRHGARDADGWLIAFIHGDFDPDTKRFQLHLHAAVAGEMREVLRRVGA